MTYGRRSRHYGGAVAPTDPWASPVAAEDATQTTLALHQPHAAYTRGVALGGGRPVQPGATIHARELDTFWTACRQCLQVWPCEHAGECKVDGEPWPCATVRAIGVGA